MKVKRLDIFILITTLITSFVASFIAYVITYKTIDSTVQQLASKQAGSLAEQTFRSIYFLMNKGYSKEEVNEFISEITKQHQNLRIHILTNSQREHRKLLNSFVVNYPIKVKKNCIKCHTGRKEGDILGFIQIEQDLSPVIVSLRRKLLLLALLLMPFPVLAALFMAYIIREKINNMVDKLKNIVEKINSVSDLSQINLSGYDFGFEELNEIKNNLEKLVERIREVAVDRKALEFELRILENFKLTNEELENWKDFMINILKKIDRFLNFLCFYTVFSEENTYKVCVFWNDNSQSSLRKCIEKVEREIYGRLLKDKSCDELPRISFHHNIIVKDSATKCTVEDIEKFSKSMIFDKPLIGGVNGIGICSKELRDYTKRIATEKLLTIMINIIGSLRVVYKYAEKLRYFATRDPLTGLYNRRVFGELLEYEIERAKRHKYKFSLMLLDIDNFKLINDTYGHKFGDEILKDVSEILRKVFRREDIIARYGGDEFVVILPMTDSEEAKSAAERLLSELERFSKPTPDGKTIKIHASIGIAVFPDSARDAKSLFVVADDMMYKAKKEGKNRYVIASKENLEKYEREKNALQIVLLEALDNSSIVPYFQPILDLKTGRIDAYEILMRIKHNGRLLTANQFIDTAEEIGIISKLDYSLLDKALEKVKKANCDPILFFNLSPKEILIPNYIYRLEDLVEKWKYKKDKIVFEITERETINNFKKLKHFVEDLKKKGFKFALDDFGSGFASFSCVKNIPIDILKIDGEFIKSMTENRADRIFVENTVLLAKTLEIKTVAEFVENEIILKTVKEMGIDYAQGYYIGKPLEKLC